MSKDSNREEFLSLLHQVVQHTPLKLEETNGTDYDRGYIFYQDMVLRDVEELETTMWEWHHQELQKAREEERERIKALFPKLNPNSDSWGTTEMERILKAIDQSELEQDITKE